MFRRAKLIAISGCISAVAACEEVPSSGSTVKALPSAGTNLTTFEEEDEQCRDQESPGLVMHHPETREPRRRRDWGE
jgi:hypothetical protein